MRFAAVPPGRHTVPTDGQARRRRGARAAAARAHACTLVITARGTAVAIRGELDSTRALLAELATKH